jgi:hypothetical protein
MALIINHPFVSSKPQGSDPTIIYGPQWNQAHSVSGTLDSTQSTYTGPGTGAVQRTVSAKLTDIVSAADFGAVGDNSTDNAVALQAFFTWLAGGNSVAPRAGVIPSGIYRTSAQLTLNGSYCSLVPVGPTESVIRYTGAGTTSDIIVIGDITGAVQRQLVFVGEIYVDSNTTMTSGAAVHIKNVVQSEFQCSIAGQNRFGAVGNLIWHGIWFDQIDNCVFAGREIFAQSDGLRVNGTVGAGAKADIFVRDGLKISSCANGIHIAGGFGGFQINSGDIIGNAVNLRISTDVAAEGNREIQIGKVALDSATNTAVQLADTLASGAYLNFANTWIASSTNAGITISSGTGYRVNITGGTIFNNTGDGLQDNSTSGSAKISITGTQFRANGGFGINAVNANPNISISGLYWESNTSGDYSTNLLTSTGQLWDDALRTWTPGLSFNNGTTGITYGTQSATYALMGKRVYFEWNVVLTSKGSSTGVVRVTGLPFSPSGSNNNANTVAAFNMASSIGAAAYLGTAVATMTLRNAATSAQLADTDFTNTSQITGYVMGRRV